MQIQKKVSHKLVKECSKNIEGNEMFYNDCGNLCNSCTVYIVLFAISFLMIIGISSAYFYFYWYIKKDVICVKFNTKTQTNIY